MTCMIKLLLKSLNNGLTIYSLSDDYYEMMVHST